MNKINLTIIVLAILIISSLINKLALGPQSSESLQKLYHEIKQRINSWWIMSALFLIALWCGVITSVVLFAVVSILALREYIMLLEKRSLDSRALLWSLLVFTPLQYYLIATSWYGMYSIFIPVYGFIFIMIRVAIKGECQDFLARVATIYWGIMTCVYLISYAPALLTLPVINFETRQFQLLFYLIVLTELSDVFQFTAGKLFGKHRIAPSISPNKTSEGLLGGIVLTGITAVLLGELSPFSNSVDFVFGALICIFGFFGGLCMSAVKRDKGCKDFGTILAGHGGVLDRIDSLCFTAPLFFHFLRYYYTR